MSVQPPRGHQVCGAEHAQRPATQKAPAPQAASQAPQWALSVCGLKHWSPQRSGVAAGQAQAPPRHARPAPQGVSLGSDSNTQYPDSEQRSSREHGSASTHWAALAQGRRGRQPRDGSHTAPAGQRATSGSYTQRPATQRSVVHDTRSLHSAAVTHSGRGPSSAATSAGAASSGAGVALQAASAAQIESQRTSGRRRIRPSIVPEPPC